MSDSIISLKKRRPKNSTEENGDTLPSIFSGQQSKMSLFNREDKYFGLDARDMFFERYQWLSRQRRIMHTSSSATSSALIFDNEIELNHPFSSRQSRKPPSPRRKDDDECSVMTWDYTNVDDEAFDEEISLLASNNLTLEATPTSPRTMYIASCIRDKVYPRAALLVRKETTSDFSLAHQGIGDKMARLLAQSLDGIPYVERVNISDNSLTDAGMEPVLKALQVIQDIKEIDLSQNVVGLRTCSALEAFIMLPHCPLQRLVLKKASMEDAGFVKIVNAITTNGKCLRDLDVSRNRLGGAEVRALVEPGFRSAGDALAAYIRSPECKLEKLDVSWNMFRLEGAITLSRSLAVNSTLTYLDLSYNALGHDGGEALGDAILDNRTLRTLLIAHNSLDSTACFTICAGVLENLALRKVCLDGNPIGERGAKALMLIPVVAGFRVEVSVNNCDISLKDDRCFFDPGEPCGSYTLHLNKPFERAIAFKMLEIVASNSAYFFRRIAYEEPLAPTKSKKARTPKPINLELVPVYNRIDWTNDAL